MQRIALPVYREARMDGDVTHNGVSMGNVSLWRIRVFPSWAISAIRSQRSTRRRAISRVRVVWTARWRRRERTLRWSGYGPCGFVGALFLCARCRRCCRRLVCRDCLCTAFNRRDCLQLPLSQLGMNTGMVIAVPNPSSLDGTVIDNAIEVRLSAACYTVAASKRHSNACTARPCARRVCVPLSKRFEKPARRA